MYSPNSLVLPINDTSKFWVGATLNSSVGNNKHKKLNRKQVQAHHVVT